MHHLLINIFMIYFRLKSAASGKIYKIFYSVGMILSTWLQKGVIYPRTDILLTLSAFPPKYLSNKYDSKNGTRRQAKGAG
jgi:hypothetical protein